MISITLPLSPEVAANLKAGDSVELSGFVYTARDATHMRLLADLEQQGKLPFDLEGQILFYAGPTPARAGRPIGAVGPTTAKRMDAATTTLLDAGIVATLGKGQRTDAVTNAVAKHQTVYFGAVGGAAALLATHIVSAEPVAYPELGTEALVRLELKDFPAFVALDSKGNDFYAQAPAEWRAFLESEKSVSGTMPTAQGEDHIPSPSSERGTFITFEGGEGAGKSTQINALQRQLEMHGYEVMVVREPGGSVVGEAIRNVLLDASHTEMTARTELFLYEAARAQVVDEIIEPALARGTTVLCDRFFDSTTAYQGYGRGLDLGVIERLNTAAVHGVVPDRTIVLDTDPRSGLARATKNGAVADRLEREELSFHERVREGFLAIGEKEPQRVRVISSEQPITAVFAEILHEVKDLFPRLEEALTAQEGDHE